MTLRQSPLATSPRIATWTDRQETPRPGIIRVDREIRAGRSAAVSFGSETGRVGFYRSVVVDPGLVIRNPEECWSSSSTPGGGRTL